MMKGDHVPSKLLHALTWGVFNHTFHASQVRACNYYVQVRCVCLCANVCVCVCVCVLAVA